MGFQIHAASLRCFLPTLHQTCQKLVSALSDSCKMIVRRLFPRPPALGDNWRANHTKKSHIKPNRHEHVVLSVFQLFSREMKVAGIAIAITSVVATAILVWLFHVITFGEPNSAYMFESEPREGYDYWRRKSFWGDFWPFVGYSTLAIAAGLIPIMALIFATPMRSRKTTMTIAVLGIVLALAPGSMTVMSVEARNFHFIFWAPPALLVGCIYAVIRSMLTLAKIHSKQDESGQPAGCSELK